MDLSEFIKTTLVSIQKGIREANEKTQQKHWFAGPKDKAEFDIAIEVAKEKGSEKGGGLAVKVVEGKISGSSKSKESSYSRIKFTVSINTNIK